MSIYDDIDTMKITEVLTKENILQSVLDAEKNGWRMLLYITEYPAEHKLSSYVTLIWSLDNDTFLGDNKNTAGHNLEYINAYFDCDISTINAVKTVNVTRFKELEVEHIDATIGLDGNFYIGRSGQLGLTPKDFEQIFERALSNYNANKDDNSKVNLLINVSK